MMARISLPSYPGLYSSPVPLPRTYQEGVTKVVSRGIRDYDSLERAERDKRDGSVPHKKHILGRTAETPTSCRPPRDVPLSEHLRIGVGIPSLSLYHES